MEKNNKSFLKKKLSKVAEFFNPKQTYTIKDEFGNTRKLKGKSGLSILDMKSAEERLKQFKQQYNLIPESQNIEDVMNNYKIEDDSPLYEPTENELPERQLRERQEYANIRSIIEEVDEFVPPKNKKSVSSMFDEVDILIPPETQAPDEQPIPEIQPEIEDEEREYTQEEIQRIRQRALEKLEAKMQPLQDNQKLLRKKKSIEEIDNLIESIEKETKMKQSQIDYNKLKNFLKNIGKKENEIDEFIKWVNKTDESQHGKENIDMLQGSEFFSDNSESESDPESNYI